MTIDTDVAYAVSAEQLRTYIARIERLEEEKTNLLTDLKELYGEAKANGFDTKTLKKIVSIRKKDKNKLAEEEALLDTYMSALGMV